MESFECQGFWWLPSDPKNKVPGILKFDPVEGSKLKLLGSLEVKEDRLTATNDLMFYTDVILGETPSEIFTLYKCWENEPGIRKSGFNIDFIFKGHHFHYKEDIIFNSVSLNYPNLDKWANIPGIVWKTANSDEISEDKPKDYFHFKKVDDIEAKLKGFKITISFNQVPVPKIPNELDLVQFPYIKIEFNKKTHFCEYEDKWSILKDLLTFGMGKAIYPLSITCYNDSINKVEVFYRVNSIIQPMRDILQKDMIFLFSDISDVFEKCLNNWYNNAEKFGPVYNLYFGTHRKPSMFAEHRFLSYIQAIEAYHSRICPKKPKRKRNWFLRERLESIFLENGDLFEILIHDSDKFVDDIVKTRNYYTHYSEDLEKKAIIKINQLVILIDKLRFTLEVCLLLELGIDKEKIREIISRNNEYEFLRAKINNQVSKSCGCPHGHLALRKLLSKKS